MNSTQKCQNPRKKIPVLLAMPQFLGHEQGGREKEIDRGWGTDFFESLKTQRIRNWNFKDNCQILSKSFQLLFHSWPFLAVLASSTWGKEKAFKEGFKTDFFAV